jgi:hypothetical protein
MNKTCLECGEKIVGRRETKFCSGCRNAFNNKINKDSTNFAQRINNKLQTMQRSGEESKATRAKYQIKILILITNILRPKGNTYYFL